MERKNAVHTFAQKDVPYSLEVVGRKGLDKERRKPVRTSVRCAWTTKFRPGDTRHGRQTRMGAMAISVNSFFAIAGSTVSIALANNDASTSSWIAFEEKYGRRCESIRDMKIQKASSSGD